MLTLADLKKGQKAKIVTLCGAKKLRIRLMELGLVPERSIEIYAIALFGDPIVVKIRGCRLSLRKSEAKQIVVELSDEK